MWSIEAIGGVRRSAFGDSPLTLDPSPAAAGGRGRTEAAEGQAAMETAQGTPLSTAVRGGRVGGGVLSERQTPGYGNTTWKLAPKPGVLLAEMAPPWASTIALEMLRPRPVPPWERVRPVSTR